MVTITVTVAVTGRQVRIHKIAIPVANRYARTGVIPGADGLCFLFQNATCGAVIHNLKLFGPTNRFNLDLGKAVLDFNPLKPFGLEIGNDLIRGLIRQCGCSKKRNRHRGKYCAFHRKVLSCPVPASCRQTEPDVASVKEIFAESLGQRL